MKLLALLFGALVRLRNWLYDHGILRSWRAPVPVVCAGSLEVGGAGKTPLALLLTERLRALGWRVALLSRGYRSALERRGGRVSPSDRAARVGDEPLLCARRLPEVPVYVGRHRSRMAEIAVSEGAEVLVLDDGFQHRRLARDLDVVVVEGGRSLEALDLLPAGPLREPASGLRRAHLLVVRGSGPAPAGWPGPVVRVVDEAAGLLQHPQGSPLPLESLAGRRVSLVAGIARPGRFAALARAQGAQLVEERFFPDHHPFTIGDLAGLRAAILTTEKDAVRLPPGTEALVLLHRLRVVEGEGALSEALSRLVQRSDPLWRARSAAPSATASSPNALGTTARTRSRSPKT
jgi:tetraacyldisaccharide 4'-kinase